MASWLGSRRLTLIICAALLCVVAAACAAFVCSLRAVDETSLPVSGRIEADETHIGVRMPARVKAVLVNEGDRVRAGQLILLLDDQDLVAKKKEASDAVAAAGNAKRAALARLASLQAEAARLRASSKGLMARMFGGKKRAEQKANEMRLQLSEVQAQVATANAELARARAGVDEASANLSYFHITSPINGVCLTRSVGPGDMVSPGQVLLTLADLNSVYLRAFVPEGQIGKVKLNQAARVFLDSAPKRPLTARVSSIDPQASFTPENVYFKQDRVKEVFGVKLAIDNPAGLAKPGMPADAQIILKKDK